VELLKEAFGDGMDEPWATLGEDKTYKEAVADPGLRYQRARQERTRRADTCSKATQDGKEMEKEAPPPFSV
jgi:hypothetical protein